MTKPQWPAISPSTLTEQVYRAVRDRILDGQIEPGEFTRERDLSAAMNVSRTPLREALTRLASEGLLERLPHRGFRVPMVSYRDLIEIYPIVSSLDVLAGRLGFPRMTPRDVSALGEVNAGMEAALANEEVDALVRLNFKFHQIIADRSGNKRLADILEELRHQLYRLEQWYYSYPEHSRRSISEHQAIIDALDVGDLLQATDILRDNMSLTKLALFDQTVLGNDGNRFLSQEGAEIASMAD